MLAPHYRTIRAAPLLTRIAHHLSTATADTVTLTRLFLSFDLDVTGHAVARKPSKKFRHSNRLHRLDTKLGERCGLKVIPIPRATHRLGAEDGDCREEKKG